MREIPKCGEFYRHFKNKMYQIVAIASHSENGEKLVIYQALYGDFGVYARPLEMFMSEVDHEKYPQVAQKYRFERVKNACEETLPVDDKTKEESIVDEAQTIKFEEPVTDKVGTLTLEEKMMDFFDTEDYEIRNNILVSMRDEMTDLLIDNLAVALDVVIPEGELPQRYEQLKNCLRTKQKYESERIR